MVSTDQQRRCKTRLFYPTFAKRCPPNGFYASLLTNPHPAQRLPSAFPDTYLAFVAETFSMSELP